MSLLDELESLAEQGNKPTSEQPAAAGADDFYRDHVKQRMVKAKDYFNKLFHKINEVRLVVQAPYPFKPGEKPVNLLQHDYKAYTEDAIDPRQLTLGFSCILSNPTAFDVSDRGAAMALSALLDRYEFNYKKLDAKDKKQAANAVRFRLQGPLQVKCALQFDGDKQIIKLLLTNFDSPGTIQYNLKPEQLDEAFMDHLGRYLIRKESSLFEEEISDDEKAELRRRLEQEKLKREAELREEEEKRKAEEAARKQNSTTGQLKKAVTQSVAENSEKLKKVMDEQLREKGEKLKSMFSRIKNRTGSERDTETASSSDPAPVPNPEPAPRQTSASIEENPGQHKHPTARPAEPVDQALPPDQSAGQTASDQQTVTSPRIAVPKEKAEQPKVFEGSASNPFLKPEDFEPVPEKEPVAEEDPVTGDDETQTQDNADTQNAGTQDPVKPLSEETAPAPAVDKTVQSTEPGKADTEASTATVSAATTAESDQTVELTAPDIEASISPVPPATPDDSDMTLEITAPEESGLSLEPIPSATDSSTPAAPEESDQTVELTAPDIETSISPVPQATPGESDMTLEITAVEIESSSPPVSPAAPDEPDLSLEPVASDTEASSQTVSAESELSMEPVEEEPGLSLEPVASDTETSSSTTEEESGLTLEDTLERDLARFMEENKK